MKHRLTLSLLLGLAIAARAVLPAAETWGRRTDGTCCQHQQTAPACAFHCAGEYAGLARQDASQLRVTRLPVRRPLRSLSAILRRYTPPPVTPFDARHSQDSAHLCATPPKRYLLSCALRL